MVELVLARAHVVLPAVPGAAQGLSLELAFRKRPAEMQARVLRGEEFALDVGDRNCLVVDLHGRDRPRRDVLDTGDVAELNLGHLDEGNNPAGRFGVSIGSVTLVPWRRSCWRESTSIF